MKSAVPVPRGEVGRGGRESRRPIRRTEGRSRALLATLLLQVGCLEGVPDPHEAGSARPWADPAPLRAGPARVILGSWTGDGHTDFYGVVGAILDRRAGTLVVANAGDATIRTFSPDGEWGSTRGGIGRGPQEFGGLAALFEYRGDSLLAFDDRREEASVWPYAGGDVRRVPAPTLPEDSLRAPKLYGALAGGRLVWAAEKPYRQPDEVGSSHPDTMLIFLTSPEGAGFDPVAETLGGRYFHYAASIHQQGRAPFSPETFAFPRDSVILFGWTERARVERVSGTGTVLDPITMSLTPVPVAGAHRAWEIANRRRVLTSRPLPPSLLEGQTAVLDILPFPDIFPVLGEVVAGEDGRIWVRGYRPPETDAAHVRDEASVWRVYAEPGGRARDLEFPAGFDLIWADGLEAVGVVRDEFDVERVVIVPLPAAARRGEP